MNLKNVKDHAAECRTNTRHLAILNYLIEAKQPRTLFQMMDVFTHKELTTDTIAMGELGLINYDRLGFCPTKFALALTADLAELEASKNEVGVPTTTIEQEGPYTGRSVTVSKEGEDHLQQINSAGFWDGDNWMSIENWINVLDLQKKFRYSASRFSHPFDEIVKDYKDEGWVVVEDESAKR